MAKPVPVANKLLASLAADAYLRLAPHLKLVTLERGETLYETVGPVKYVHFPVSAVISGFVDMPGGASAEVALVGNDGAVGVTALLCGARLPFRMLIDTAGEAYRGSQSAIQSELRKGNCLEQVLMRYMHARMVQVAGTVVCNSHHSVEQRLCRALLMRLERAADNSLLVTQEMLAEILGVRRPAVSKAAANLRRAGVIDYRRGRVAVVSCELLHASACECFDTIKQQISQLSKG